MDTTKVKAGVLRAAIDHLRTMESELRERITDLKAVTIGDENAESASQTESHRGSDIDLMNSLGERIEHVLRDIALLETIDPATHHEQVQFGSVVHTDDRNFLVATSIDEFKAGGRTYLGLSPRVPLVQHLNGARTGQTVEFNRVKYAIEEVF
jgi:transcription elongation GreA/GreB family factor